MIQMDLKNPGTQKLILSVVLGIAILAMFFFTHFLPFGYQPQREALNTLKTEYDKKSTELARARATVSDLPRFEAEYERLHERWVQAAELLPTDRQIPVLLRRITLAAEQTGVEFVVFRPNSAKTAQYYTELPMQLSVFGGYHQIGSFVAELSNMRRIITIGNLTLKAYTKMEETGATVAADFTASAYSLNSSSAPAPVPSAAAPIKEGASRAR
jgi:type IV pilus assembly protein PilO